MQDGSANVNGGPRPAPWTGAEMALAVLLVWYFWPSAAYALVKAAGVERWYYGGAEDVSSRLLLWTRPLALPPQVLTYPLLFAAFSGARPAQLGLTAHRLVRNVLAGLVGVLLLAPPVLGVYRLASHLSGSSEELHPLTKMAQQSLYPAEWVMLFFAAMVAAPLVEELTFRGVLQPWLAARRWGGHAAMLGAFVLAVAFRGEWLLSAWREGAGILAAAVPALFVLALLPVYVLVWALARSPVPPAVFGTSLLFGCLHTSVWPTPIPLFVLGLGLGVLAYRSRSLVGPVVLHALFNGIGCVQLLINRFD